MLSKGITCLGTAFISRLVLLSLDPVILCDVSVDDLCIVDVKGLKYGDIWHLGDSM